MQALDLGSLPPNYLIPTPHATPRAEQSQRAMPERPARSLRGAEEFCDVIFWISWCDDAMKFIFGIWCELFNGDVERFTETTANPTASQTEGANTTVTFSSDLYRDAVPCKSPTEPENGRTHVPTSPYDIPDCPKVRAQALRAAGVPV